MSSSSERGAFRFLRRHITPERSAHPCESSEAPSGHADYELSFASGDSERGFLVTRAADGRELSWHSLGQEPGLAACGVVGVSDRTDILQRAEFAPGLPLTVVHTSDQPDAVAVWDSTRMYHVGFLPMRQGRRIAEQLNNGEHLCCLSLWETRSAGRRVALRVLIASAETRVTVASPPTSEGPNAPQE